MAQPNRAPEPGDRLQPFEVASESGSSVSWKAGRATLISFCAFWCDTWKEQLRRVAATRSAVAGLPADIVVISIDGQWTELGKRAAYLNGLKRWKDPGGAWSRSVGIDKVPYTLVLNPSGVIEWVQHGIARSSDMSNYLRAALYSNSSDGGIVYLTFDDFPKSNGHNLLDVLRAQGVKATFFCMGSRLAENRGLLQRALREGNSLQIHGWEHSRDAVDAAKCERALHSLLGIHAALIRAPGSEAVVRLDGSRVQGRTVDPYDFQRPGTREILRRVLSNLRPGCIIQLHAGVSQTEEALPEIISGVKAQGYRFGTLK